jgi:hypothetical protein
LIYDPKVSDPSILRLLLERSKPASMCAYIGKVSQKRGGAQLTAERYPGKRLHVRAIIRDGRRPFWGARACGDSKLDKRREVGAIVTDAAVVKQNAEGFRGRLGEDGDGQDGAGKEQQPKDPDALAARAS